MEEVIKETIELINMYAESLKESSTLDGEFTDKENEDFYNYHLGLINSLKGMIGECENSDLSEYDLAEYVYACPDCGWMGTSDQEMACESCGEAHEVECPECHEANLFLRCISFGGCAVGEDSGCNCGNCNGVTVH